jgi:hypothetical protein
MKPKFRLFRRGKTFWCEDTKSGRQQSLGTKNKGDATRLLHGRNEAHGTAFHSQCLLPLIRRWYRLVTV